MMLGMCRRPYPDELFYGYVRMLFQKNGFRMMGEVDRILGNGLENVHVRINYPTGISKICEVIENVTFPDVEKAISMTPFGALSFNMEYKKQARLAETMLQSEASCIPTVSKIEKDKIHLCPECWKEDLSKYGEGYLHLSHHLPGVKVCAEHGSVLYQVKMETRRRSMQEIDIKNALPIDAATQDIEQEIIYAKEMKDICYRNNHIFLWNTCPDCGRKYLEHPYSKETDCGCPFCNERTEPTEVIRRRLKSQFGDEYDVEPEFSGIHNAMVIHTPCGDRIRKLDNLLYGEGYVHECQKLTPEYLQRQFDPSGHHWQFYEKPDFVRKRKRIYAKHLKCNHDFDVFTSHFNSKEGGYCPYCDNLQKVSVINDVDSDYEIIGSDKNNHERAAILHKACGVTFFMDKTRFLAGEGCPVCTPKYGFDEVRDAVLSCTQGYGIEKGKKNGTVTITLPGGVVLSGVHITVVMMDLKADEPSIFKNRIRRYKDERSIWSVIYENVKRETFQKGYWCFLDGLDGLEVTPTQRSIVQKMEKLGYIQRVGIGQYRVENCGKGDKNL